MPVARARPIVLRAADRERLKQMAYGHKTEYRLRMRAQVVLHAARGRSNARIARETRLHLDTVRTWRGRFAEHGLSGLSDRERTGRLTSTFPNAVMVHTPVHASWTNQIEIFFSIVQRKVVSPNDFTDLGEIRDRLRAFEDRYNATAQPFQWKFTTSDLDDLLARLDRHTADHPEESSVALAA
ncbi:helix-turn-helix domain-containing protein [Streptomyces atratus]